MISRTPGESNRLTTISGKLRQLSEFLMANHLDEQQADCDYWFHYLAAIKRLLGNFDNDVSFAACLMAKQFLMSRHDLPAFDIDAKLQGAPGLDIDELASNGERVIAEVKTTVPYGVTDFGANQRASVTRDLEKLAACKASFRYFFVTDRNTFAILKNRYADKLEGVAVVLLPEEPQEKLQLGDTSLLENHRTTVSKGQPPDRQLPSQTGGQADAIRKFIRDELVAEARKAGRKTLQVRSGDVAKLMGLRNRYPNICSVMRSWIIEALCGVRIRQQSGSDGANFVVIYEL
ncbi:MAG: hypothetical protein M1531_00320 [Chloroflexi bacterium]|nr:hypothetical protein [Chloroflexota bacterium]